jgi:large subunit ribosomal protein L5
MASTQAAPPARLKTRYLEEIRPALMSRFGYSSVMQAPKLQKITVNMGVGMAKTDSKVLRAATEQLATIAGQQPSVRRARKSIAAFKLREGNPVGVAVTLRGDRGYEFLDRLVSIAIPRIRDFRGLNPRAFDGRGNYSMGIREQIIFPEIDYDSIDQVRGMDVTITTSAASDAEAFALLASFGLPFSADRRPRGFETLDVEGTVNAAPSGSPRQAPPEPPPAPSEEEPAEAEASAPQPAAQEAEAEPAAQEQEAEAEPAAEEIPPAVEEAQVEEAEAQEARAAEAPAVEEAAIEEAAAEDEPVAEEPPEGGEAEARVEEQDQEQDQTGEAGQEDGQTTQQESGD